VVGDPPRQFGFRQACAKVGDEVEAEASPVKRMDSCGTPPLPVNQAIWS
jgi:hypothetical protein